MEVGKQIKKFRQDLNLSQEELADKVFVSRQTISNWENGKNYPDLKSLVILSQLFHTSIDILVKGDIIEMKKQILQDDTKKANDIAKNFKKDSSVFSVLLIAETAFSILLIIYLVSAAPEFDFFKTPLSSFTAVSVFALWAALSIVSIFFASRVERYKRELNIQTFREILDFLENNRDSQNTRA